MISSYYDFWGRVGGSVFTLGFYNIAIDALDLNITVANGVFLVVLGLALIIIMSALESKNE